MSQPDPPPVRQAVGLPTRLPAGLLRGEFTRPWLLVLLLLVALVGLVYGPTINLTYYKEDPSDIGQSLGHSLGEHFSM